GDGLVIHGPPGTGKSQVIMNLISDNLLRNKKVLLVCEKRAALDVVYNRLASKSIHKYCLLVHDTQNDRNPIFKKISDTLEEFEIKEDGYLRTNNNEQTKKLAGEFDANLKHLKKIIDLIHEKNEFGTNLYTLYRKSRREDENILDLSNPIFDKITYDYINSAAHKISQIANLEYDFNSKEHPLYLRKPFLTDFDELKFKKDLKINIERFEKIETIFSKKDFSKDLELINSDNLTFDFLLEVVDSLEYLDEQKNSFFRFLNLKYIKNYLKYKPLSKNNYFSELLKKWTSIKNPLLDLIKSKEFFENFFHSKLYQELIANSLKFKQSSPVLKNILSSLKDVDKIIILDKTKSDFTKAEKEIMIGCREIYPNKINDIKLLWEELIKNSFYLKWINNKESKHIDLKKFSYNLYEELRNKMLSLLDDRQNLIPELIHEEFRNRYAKTKWAGFDRDGRRKNYNTHKSLIHEVNKKRMRVSIRKLVEKFGDGLLNLFPVWMCSPETVSNIFPLEKNLFDVIIFDEASQCKIERAMPAIIRGKKLIVAGDEKQLPPTTFFTTSIEEDNEEDLSDDEEDLLNDESLLVRSKSIFSGRRLLYHYRSKHPELINFSNHAFYNGNLKVIPRNEINVDSPIIYTQTKGLWEDRCNLVEAVEVAKLICNLLKSNDKGYTFGVITFNVNQMDAIEDAMEELAQKDPIFARLLDQEKNRHNQDEYIGLFVKNIENVQGDERDIIIISVGYGFDNAGKFRYRFGPLNGMYGPNRLNVAISRAKHKSYVFTSFSPSDLKYEGKFEGPKLLGKYLAYCKAISDDSKKQSDSILNSLHESELSEVGFDNFDSDFEAEVKDALTELGYTVVTQAGCQGYSIDLAVIHPTYKNLFVVGIECDGEMYHSTKSAKDRDLYRQSVLESAGWNILRVWSRDWWIDSNKVIKRLDREIKVLALQTKPEKINLPKIKLQEEKNVITKKIEAKVREEIKQEIELDDLTLVCNSCLNEFKESESRNGRCPECGHNRSVVKFSGNTLR
ncbi:MAG: DUF559 domain-containing protein, partial [Nanoarchaeota archaeon]|nr:DUF559 domain-containing protein [Nanoarchaeota archaeon]